MGGAISWFDKLATNGGGLIGVGETQASHPITRPLTLFA
jgi:hypothetical protein